MVKTSTQTYLERRQLVNGLQENVHVIPVHFLGVPLLLLLEVVQVDKAHVDPPALLVDAQNEVVSETLVVEALIVVLDILVLETDVAQTDDQESRLSLLCVCLGFVDRFDEIAGRAGQILPVDETLNLANRFWAVVCDQATDEGGCPGALRRLMLADASCRHVDVNRHRRGVLAVELDVVAHVLSEERTVRPQSLDDSFQGG